MYLRGGSGMFQIGDKLVYGSTGVCLVEDITTVNLPGVDKNRLYYVLRPMYQDGIIRTPVDNEKVFKRPVISRQEAEALIDMIPTVKAAACNEKIWGCCAITTRNVWGRSTVPTWWR